MPLPTVENIRSRGRRYVRQGSPEYALEIIICMRLISEVVKSSTHYARKNTLTSDFILTIAPFFFMSCFIVLGCVRPGRARNSDERAVRKGTALMLAALYFGTQTVSNTVSVAYTYRYGPESAEKRLVLSLIEAASSFLYFLANAFPLIQIFEHCFRSCWGFETEAGIVDVLGDAADRLIQPLLGPDEAKEEIDNGGGQHQAPLAEVRLDRFGMFQQTRAQDIADIQRRDTGVLVESADTQRFHLFPAPPKQKDASEEKTQLFKRAVSSSTL